MITIEEISDLSPNMRAALIGSDGEVIYPRATWWITLQGLASRGLIYRPSNRHDPHRLTSTGQEYRDAIFKFGDKH